MATRTKGVIIRPKKVHFFNLDACDEDDSNAPMGLKTEHWQKQYLVGRLAKELLDAEYHPVSFPKGSRSKAVQTFFEEKMVGLGEDDLVMVYFHGGAGWTGEEYAWKFDGGYPKKDIDAHELIQMFVDSGIDVVLLLDCFIADRYHDKWKPDNKHATNIVEIIARGQHMQRSDGRIINYIDDFTQNLCADLRNFVEKINIPAKQGGYAGWTAPLSILNLLARNTQMTANPRRIWLQRTRARDTRHVSRFVMLPDDIRKTGRIRFFQKQIQGAPIESIVVNDEEDTVMVVTEKQPEVGAPIVPNDVEDDTAMVVAAEKLPEVDQPLFVPADGDPDDEGFAEGENDLSLVGREKFLSPSPSFCA